jgi:hypothetical protein
MSWTLGCPVLRERITTPVRIANAAIIFKPAVTDTRPPHSLKMQRTPF